jgi:hypothetical protein
VLLIINGALLVTEDVICPEKLPNTEYVFDHLAVSEPNVSLSLAVLKGLN